MAGPSRSAHNGSAGSSSRKSRHAQTLYCPSKDLPCQHRGRILACLLLLAVACNALQGAAAQSYHPQCGVWQRHYKQLHDSITSGAAPERYAMQWINGGTADVLAGAVSVFYFSVLTGRAFKLLGENWPHAFQTKSVDWRDKYSGQHYMELSNDPASGVQHAVQGWTVEWRKGELYNAFLSGNLSTFRTAPKVMFVTNMGLTHALFKNPLYQHRLHSMGLRPETAFGCALDFLFEPWPHAMRPFAPIMSKLADPQALTIGIQIRVGDKVFKKPDQPVNASVYDYFFKCASQIEEGLVRPNQTVWWLLVSDSMAVRQEAEKKYGPKLLTMTGQGNVTGFKVHHVVLSTDADTVATAAAEIWVLSMCRNFVLSIYSGFGRVAMARGLGWGVVHSADNRNPNWQARCDANRGESFRYLASHLPPYL